jgi:hypothetical protein
VSTEPERSTRRVADACFAVFLGTMALYGAVAIIKAIFVWLCFGVLLALVALAIWRVAANRYRGW